MFANTTALILVLGMIFQFFTMMLNTILAVWSPELYPTAVRAMGTSVVNGIGNIAGAVMPFPRSRSSTAPASPASSAWSR